MTAAKVRMMRFMSAILKSAFFPQNYSSVHLTVQNPREKKKYIYIYKDPQILVKSQVKTLKTLVSNVNSTWH